MNIILHDIFCDKGDLTQRKILRTMYLFDIDIVEVIPNMAGYENQTGEKIYDKLVLAIHKNQHNINFLCLGEKNIKHLTSIIRDQIKNGQVEVFGTFAGQDIPNSNSIQE